MKYTYLAIDISAIAVPFIATFHPRIRFYKQWPFVLTAMLLSGLAFISWDIFFTATRVWGFNPDYLCGVYFFNLPLEEVLFFVCIPYACMFSYHCLITLRPGLSISGIASAYISWGLIVGGGVASIVFLQHKYTGATFLLLTFFILYARNKSWAGRFYLCYAAMLLPFLIINGILTGSLMEAPVVWYNNNEIIGVRLLTIPVEDVFYGLILMGSQVVVYEWFMTTSRWRFNIVS